jgi:hypothetical protein
MNDKTFFADVNLPFHVWVREPGTEGFRWVLRDASGMGAASTDTGLSGRDLPRAQPAPRR